MLLADVLTKVNGPERIRIRNRENREMIYEGFRGTMEHYIPVDDWIRWEVVDIHVSSTVRKRQRVIKRIPVEENRTIAESCKTGEFQFSDLEVMVFITFDVIRLEASAGKRDDYESNKFDQSEGRGI